MAQRPRFPAWARSTDEVLQHYKVDLEGGLTSDQVPSSPSVCIRGRGKQLLEAHLGQAQAAPALFHGCGLQGCRRLHVPEGLA